MRTLLAVSLVMMGFAASAEAQTRGAKSKSFNTQTSRSNLGFSKYNDDRRSAVGSRYIHQGFPIWAARAFQPQRDR